jgi:hypothetical protein
MGYCDISYCNNSVWFRKYCSNHRCTAFGCGRSGYPTYGKCQNHHLCGEPKCKNKVMSNAYFCPFHRCSYPDCNAIVKSGESLCSFHLK